MKLGIDWTDYSAEQIRVTIESRYNATIDHYFDGDILKSMMVGHFITSIVLYWGLGLLYFFIDLTGRPKFLLRYKIQSDVSQVETKSLGKLVGQILFNQTVAMSIALFFFNLRIKNKLLNPHVPTWNRFLLEWVFFILSREVLFYYIHRTLHHPTIYKYVHKQHHEWQTPVALVAIYCHPVEHVLGNIIPLVVGPGLMNSHELTIYLWEIYAIVLTLNDHCGYHFPLAFPPVFHDFHHLKFNTNYGILGFLDWIHGTDAIFKKSKFVRLNKIYFTLTPPKLNHEE